MKKFLLVAVVAALPAAGCIQTLPDGSVVAAPATSSLLAQQSDAPPPQHQVRDGNRIVGVDPDLHIRASFRRDRCQNIFIEEGCADSGQ